MADDETVDNELESNEPETQDQVISLFLAIGMVVAALIVGLVVGYAVTPKDQGGVIAPIGGPGATDAPSLSSDQLEGGELPTGHPPVPGAEATAADSSTGAVDGETDSATSTANDAGDDESGDSDEADDSTDDSDSDESADDESEGDGETE